MAASALGNEPGEQGRPEQPDSADTGNHPVQHPPEHRHEPGASSAVSDPRHGQPSRSSASSTANVDQHAHAQQRSNEDSGAQGDNTRDQSRVPQKPAPCRDESEEARHNRRPDDDDDDDDDGRGGGGCGRGRQGGSSGSSASSSRGKAETQNVSRGSGDPQSGCGNPDTKRAKTSTRRTACTPNAPVSCTTQEAQDPQDGPVVSFAWRPFDLARSTWHTVMNSVYTVLGVDTRPLTSTRQPGCRHHKHHHRRRHRGTSTAAVHTAHCCEDCFRALRESVRLSSARTLPKSTRDWKAVPKDAMAGPWDHRHPAVTSPPRGFEQAAVRVSGGIHDCTGAAMCTACFNAMNMAVLPHLACLLQRAPQHQWTVMWVRGSIEMTRTFSNHPIKAHLETIADLGNAKPRIVAVALFHRAAMQFRWHVFMLPIQSFVMRTTLALHVDAADATKVLRAHARPLAVRSGGDGDSDSATHLVTRIKMGAEEIKLQDPVAVPRDRLVEATRAVAEYINDAYQIGVKELDRAVQGSLDLSCLPKRDVRVDDVDLQ
ncbi:hypothetical protein PTSG_11365 [Salpingoeca rosetta]|uniref:Uncharacterized protein n=1 Tax=Salpingoeca rosetta (strain ATCC 50818 / BSB-021) TaxID=946362 RepID=F2UT69_SALR5|nr:uncharacterized protein PTSG_11365 [Salpingoeca rosetta]EGD81328.1 hypothetical protein PTSG_11365 [Salpingoeca rosetta]|eukprot:XP_004987643.1 hypothetical protein PTSG_11365 [Salpingoeca rosetta]